MRRRLLLLALILVVGIGAFAVTPPGGARSMRQFDSTRMADLELAMWQAYYAKERVRLFALLVTMLHEQYHYSWARATGEGFHLARAAARFADLDTHYETVLPDLEQAYGQAREWMRAGFDPHAVARAELAWWVARRDPRQNSAENVGRLIAEEYSLLYEAPVERVARAALLRAEAARLRDEGAPRPDWEQVGSLLRESYRALLIGLNERYARVI
ncbi:MAG TPA: hypothetical protein VGJ29_08940 [Vicinamibacterales bacterium]|jgi:hypothetical protein